MYPLRKSEDQNRCGHESYGREELGVAHPVRPFAVVQVKLFQVGSVGGEQQQDDRANEDYVDGVAFEVERVVQRHGTSLKDFWECFDLVQPFIMFFGGLLIGFVVGAKAGQLIAQASGVM